jgi:hypothetical protein
MSTEAPATGTEGTPAETTEPATGDGLDFSTLADLGKSPEDIRKALEHSRKWEDRAKANAKAAEELEKLRQESMTEQERAVEAARTEARQQVLAEVGSSRVEDAVRVALAGRPVDPDALLEGLDRSRFLNDDGTPDRDGIAAWVDRIAPAPDPSKAPPADLGQGARTSSSSSVGLGSDPLLDGVKRAIGAR